MAENCYRWCALGRVRISLCATLASIDEENNGQVYSREVEQAIEPLHPQRFQPLHAHGLRGAEFLGEDLHAVFLHHPAEGIVLGFGNVGLPAVEIGDEVVFIDVFGGVGEAALVADLDGF